MIYRFKCSFKAKSDRLRCYLYINIRNQKKTKAEWNIQHDTLITIENVTHYWLNMGPDQCICCNKLGFEYWVNKKDVV